MYMKVYVVCLRSTLHPTTYYTHIYSVSAVYGTYYAIAPAVQHQAYNSILCTSQ